MHGRVPFECGGIPGIWRGGFVAEEAVDEVGEEEELCCGQEDR